MESWTITYMFISFNLPRTLQGLPETEKINYPPCVKDKYGFLALAGDGSSPNIKVRYDNSATLCTSLCKESRYLFSGTKQRLCICGNKIKIDVEVSMECETKCPGNGEETCGGKDSVSLRHIVYEKTITKTPGPIQLEPLTTIALTPSSQPTDDDFTDEYTEYSFTEYTKTTFSVFPSTPASKTVPIKTDSNNPIEMPKLSRPETSSESKRTIFMAANLTTESTANISPGFLSVQAINTYVSPKTAQMIPNYPVCVKDLDSLVEPFANDTKTEVRIYQSNSATLCTAVCKELRYKFSGTKNYMCICVNGINHGSDLSAECETNCPGDAEETCGGEDGVLLRRIWYTNASSTKGFPMIVVYISLPVGVIIVGCVILLVSLLFRRCTRPKSETSVKQCEVSPRHFLHEPGGKTMSDDDHYQTIDPDISQYEEDSTYRKTACGSSDAGYITPVHSSDTAGYVTSVDLNEPVGYITPIFSKNTMKNYQYSLK